MYWFQNRRDEIEKLIMKKLHVKGLEKWSLLKYIYILILNVGQENGNVACLYKETENDD